MIRVDIKNTEFYKELSRSEAESFFSFKAHKYIPNIDNIYYSVSLSGDKNENPELIPLFRRLSAMKEQVKKDRKPLRFNDSCSLEVDWKSFQIYKYCLCEKDLYDVFILDYLPNESTPRILVQIRSYGLWLKGWKTLVTESFQAVKELLSCYGQTVNKVYENRIDYCYHTNAVKEPERVFSDRSAASGMKTTMQKYHVTGRVEKGAKIRLMKDYFALGERKSNYVFVRFYNKALEVIEQGYKGYFFEIWRRNGLISEYDEYCFETAYKDRNYDSIHRARLEFYVKHGRDDALRRAFSAALQKKNLTAGAYKRLADEYMPECTKVLNAEFETKRKFYYLSDAFIDTLSEAGTASPELSRLWKIINNRNIFLDWLTSRTVSFHRQNGDYADWWSRLRSTKLDCLNTDAKLVRDYSNRLDHELMRRRFIGSVAANAVYQGSDGSFIDDLQDLLSEINDSDKYYISLRCYDGEGEVQDDLVGKYMESYRRKRDTVRNRLRNRLERPPEINTE